jgi:predicted nucleotidyltransferase
MRTIYTPQGRGGASLSAANVSPPGDRLHIEPSTRRLTRQPPCAMLEPTGQGACGRSRGPWPKEALSESRILIPEEQVAACCRRNQVRRLALFGSGLREGFCPDSDVDVLVAFEPGVRVSFLALGRMQRELSALLGRPVDLVPRDGLKPMMREEVLPSAEVPDAA